MNKDKNLTDAQALTELQSVIERLVAPGGCPWDQKQTPTTMCDYLAEEAFELIEAVRSGDVHESMEELGDVIFILLFMANRFTDSGDFNLADSLNYSAAKMIRRHPHVFGDKKFDNIDELWDNWEKTKREENKGTNKKRVFDSLPKGLPPLLRAYRINSKAARNRFTWDTDEAVEAQLKSEWEEWQEALASGDENASEQEFGDYIFTLIELGRRKGIKANAALDFANQKFLTRFAAMEELAEKKGLIFSDLTFEEKDALWDEVKSGETE